LPGAVTTSGFAVEVVASGRVQRNVKPPEPPLAFAVNEIDVAQADAVVIVTVGGAPTVTVRVQKLVPPPEPVMSSLKVNDPAEPAFTQTVAALVAPQNVAPEVLSVKDQLWVPMKAPDEVYCRLVDPGQTGFGPEISQVAQVLKLPSTKSFSVAVVEKEDRVSTKKLEKHCPAKAGNALRLTPPSKKALAGMLPPSTPPFGVYGQQGGAGIGAGLAIENVLPAPPVAVISRRCVPSLPPDATHSKTLL
jgi:hypothetical protein